MSQDNTPAEAALRNLEGVTRQYRKAPTPSRRQALRAELYEAVRLVVAAGVKQAHASRVSGLSPAQVSRIARGATSGRTSLPPAEYLVHTIPAQEVIARYRAGESTTQIGQTYECSDSTIRNILKRNGVPRRAGRTVDLPVPIEEVARRYLHDRQEIQQIAAELGVRPNLISRRLAAAGVRVPVGHRRMDLPDAEIVARYNAGESALRLAAEFGVSDTAIRRRVRESRTRAEAS